MNLKKSRLTLLIIIFLFCFSACSPAIYAETAQDEDTKAYKQAYNLITEEEWDEAHKALTQFLSKYPNSPWADDARFWQCYSQEKLDYDYEEVYNCYKRFISEYPDSKWVDDAKSNMVEIYDWSIKTENRIIPQLSAFIQLIPKLYQTMVTVSEM